MKLRVLPILLTVIMLTPWVVAAQAQGGGNPCTSGVNGDIGQCVSQIYLWSLGLSAMLAVVMTVFGGYLVMSARGNAQQSERGKSFIISSLIGMGLLMGAYLLLNTINPDLVNFELQNLDKINTVQNTGTGSSAGGNTGGTGGSGNSGGGAGVGCQNCVTLEAANVPIKANNACAPGFGACQIEDNTAQKLYALSILVSGWQVTEAWPPTGYSINDPNGIHSNSCHGNATCVDANFVNSADATPQNINYFITQASNVGLRAVYEVSTQDQKDQLVARGVSSSSVQVVEGITAAHFSVYNS